MEGRGYEPYEAVRRNALILLITEGYSYIVVVLFFVFELPNRVELSFHAYKASVIPIY